jgi:glutamyl-tRNA synthetase
MIKMSHAYPCFITKEELDNLRETQTTNKVRPGIYGKYATNRNLSFGEIKNKIDAGEKYVLRMRATGNIENKNKFVDEFLGEHMIPENDEDFVVLKSDGIPTYHFAHVTDDYLLGTTFVTRAEEWWSSLPKHLSLWDALSLPRPKYGHIMPINKTEQKVLEDGSIKNTVRKLSKRKDPEASMSFYDDQGYSSEAVTAYLYRLANPNFDDWFTENVSDKKNNALKIDDYVLNMEEMKRGSRGPLRICPLKIWRKKPCLGPI